MNHSDEWTLNEYLDGVLAAPERDQVEAHLATCAACRDKLAQLQLLFAALADVADAPVDVDPTADLRTQVMVAIARNRQAELAPSPLFPWLRFLLAAQVVTALALLLVLWPFWQSRLTDMTVATGLLWGSFDLSSLLMWEEGIAWLTAVMGQIEITGPIINLATGQWLLLVSLAFLAWFIGNRLLFAPSVRRRT